MHIPTVACLPLADLMTLLPRRVTLTMPDALSLEYPIWSSSLSDMAVMGDMAGLREHKAISMNTGPWYEHTQ